MRRTARARSAWPLVVAVLGLAAILVGGVAFVAQRAVSLPAEWLGKDARPWPTCGASPPPSARGPSPPRSAASPRPWRGRRALQFATLRQDEVFSRRDQRSLFWGQLALPDVVVEARAPVEYTYYLDFEKPWTFRLEGETLRVEAPAIEWNAPALDASALRYEVREGSVLRDEAAVLAALRASLTEATRHGPATTWPSCARRGG